MGRHTHHEHHVDSTDRRQAPANKKPRRFSIFQSIDVVEYNKEWEVNQYENGKHKLIRCQVQWKQQNNRRYYNSKVQLTCSVRPRDSYPILYHSANNVAFFSWYRISFQTLINWIIQVDTVAAHSQNVTSLALKVCVFTAAERRRLARHHVGDLFTEPFSSQSISVSWNPNTRTSPSVFPWNCLIVFTFISSLKTTTSKVNIHCGIKNICSSSSGVRLPRPPITESKGGGEGQYRRGWGGEGRGRGRIGGYSHEQATGGRAVLQVDFFDLISDHKRKQDMFFLITTLVTPGRGKENFS